MIQPYFNSPKKARRTSWWRWWGRFLPGLFYLAGFLALTLATLLTCTLSLLALSRTETVMAVNPVTIRARLPTLTPTAPAAPLTALVVPTTGVAGQAEPNPRPTAVATAVGVPSAPAPNNPTPLPGQPQPPAPVDVTVATPGLTMAADPAPSVEPGATAAPSPAPSATMTPILPTNTATPIPTETPTSAPTEPPTATPLPPGWSFASVRIQPGQEDGLLLYGTVINNTGSTQALELVKGIFYDGQGQVIAGDDDIYGYWPVDVVLPGGAVPFELFVESVSTAANFDLSVEAEATGETLQQDFEFLDLSPQSDDEAYCLQGRLQNHGAALQNYVVITAILYDDQGKVINFGDSQDLDPEEVGSSPTGFEVCVGPPNQGVARYELRAWGQ